MAGKFYLKKFAEIDINDVFFDSLKKDYPGTASSTGFMEWFKKKSDAGATALIFEDTDGIGAFVVLKEEKEEIELQDRVLPEQWRIKISTLRIAERYRGQRIGEGAIGLILWKWQKSKCDEIYVTVFEKHTDLISQLEHFGFRKIGVNLNGEIVYIKDKRAIDFSDPYKAFPFIKSDFDEAGYVIIEDHYHDTMFAYSELANNKLLQDNLGCSVTNGISKIYVGRAVDPKYKVGEPVLIYRRYTQGEGKRYRSCVTSFCVVTDVIQAKRNNRYLMTFEEVLQRIGNKSVFDRAELERQYKSNSTVTIVEMLYYGYFGAGNNVNMDWLDKNGCWGGANTYPTDYRLSPQQFKKVLTEGKVDVQNVIID